MKYLWLFSALLISALVLTCAVKHSQDYACWFSHKQNQEDQQFKAALEMLKEYPTAAGKKK